MKLWHVLKQWLKPRGQSDTFGHRLMLLGISILMVFLVFFFMKLFHLTDLVELLELKAYDLRMSLQWNSAKQMQPSPDVVIISYDDPTLSALEEEFGTWPWPRKVHADMIDFLEASGIKLLAFDMMFVSHQRGSEASDQALIDAFLKYPNVYISMNFDNNWLACNRLGKAPKKEDIERLKPLMLTVDNKLDTKQSHLALKTVQTNTAHNPPFYDNDAMTFNNFRRIMPEFFEAKSRIAIINHGRDKDGVSRGNPPFFRFLYNEPLYTQSLPLKQDPTTHQWLDSSGKTTTEEGILLDPHGQPISQLTPYFFPYLGLRMVMDLKVPNPADRKLTLTPDGHLTFPGYDIPLSPSGALLINWFNVNVQAEDLKLRLQQTRLKLKQLEAQPASPDRIKLKEQLLHEISLYENTLAQPYEAEPYRMISAWRVLTAAKHYQEGTLTDSDRKLAAFFKDKVAFVGTTAVSTYDIKTTPIRKLLPGVVLQANLFDNLYQNKHYMHRATPVINWGIIALLSLLSAAFIFQMRSVLNGVLTMASLLFFYLTINILIFKDHYLWVDVCMPIVACIITTTATFMVKYISRDEDYKKTYKLATTDGLTGLYNHRFFQEHLAKSIEYAQRYQHKFSLVLIDIDFFKKFNDTYGHQAGDEVLRHVARKLKNSVRSIDLVARYGGEEMAVILEKASEQEALDVAEKLVSLIAEEAYPIAEGIEKHVTISVGVATFPSHGKSPAQLIEFADQGLYRAKKNGRNQVGMQFDPT